MKQSMFNTKYCLTNELIVDREGSREMLRKELEVRDFQEKNVKIRESLPLHKN